MNPCLPVSAWIPWPPSHLRVHVRLRIFVGVPARLHLLGVGHYQADRAAHRQRVLGADFLRHQARLQRHSGDRVAVVRLTDHDVVQPKRPRGGVQAEKRRLIRDGHDDQEIGVAPPDLGHRWIFDSELKRGVHRLG